MPTSSHSSTVARTVPAPSPCSCGTTKPGRCRTCGSHPPRSPDLGPASPEAPQDSVLTAVILSDVRRVKTGREGYGSVSAGRTAGNGGQMDGHGELLPIDHLIEVRTRFDRQWVRGFSVAEPITDPDLGYRV